MGEPCHNWFSDMEMQDDDFFNQRHKINSLDVEDQIFREIMQHHHHHHHQPAFSSESDSHSPANQTEGGNGNTNITNNKSGNNLVPKNNNINNNNNSSISMIFSQHAPLKPSTSTSPTTYILSFDDSTVVAATPETYSGKRPYHEQAPSKGVVEKHEVEPKANQTRKGRSSSGTLDHIMAERKRRRELTERFIALSATIPGLKKIDKSTILSEAITHVKQLKERVRELEEQSKKISVESVSFIRKSQIATEEGTTSNAMNSGDCYGSNEALPTVEARVLKKDVLIRIHCKKQNGIVLKILGHLKSQDLSAISNSVLPFGNSTLDISIIAQMGDKFNVAMNDLVKNLRMAILEPPEVQQ